MNGNYAHNNSSSSVSNVMNILHQELEIMCELVNEMKLCYKFQALDVR